MHRSPLIKDLRLALGGENVIFAPSELAVYDCDAFTLRRNPPEAAVFPRSSAQVAAAVKICSHYGVSIVPRGGGTGLAGGCLPVERSVVLMLTRMNRVLEISLRDRWAVVEAGVSNSQLNKALAGTGWFFAAEPATQGAGTIGGNVAANAAGANFLKYGAIVNQLLGLEAVLSDGSIAQFGPIDDPASLDLMGLIAGAEGTLAVVTKVWLRLTPAPRNYRTTQVFFSAVEDAINAVTQILDAGIVPSAVELMDHGIISVASGTAITDIPADARAALLIEIDGPAPGLNRKQEQIVSLLTQNNAQNIRTASTVDDRAALWKFRRSAIPAAGDCPDFQNNPGDCPNFRAGENGTIPLAKPAPFHAAYIIEDCVAPRTRLPQMLQKIAEIGQKHQVRILNVAHAGDGSLHPIILYNHRDPASIARALTASRELLEACIATGGGISGEHGVGSRKTDLMPMQFKAADLEALKQVRYSFDPRGTFNPGKTILGVQQN
jgi:glycolate oxidase